MNTTCVVKTTGFAIAVEEAMGRPSTRCKGERTTQVSARIDGPSSGNLRTVSSTRTWCECQRMHLLYGTGEGREHDWCAHLNTRKLFCNRS